MFNDMIPVHQIVDIEGLVVSLVYQTEKLVSYAPKADDHKQNKHTQNQLSIICIRYSVITKKWLTNDNLNTKHIYQYLWISFSFKFSITNFFKGHQIFSPLDVSWRRELLAPAVCCSLVYMTPCSGSGLSTFGSVYRPSVLAFSATSVLVVCCCLLIDI